MQGVPAVAVNVGGVEELIFNGETGWIVEKHDKIDFSGAVLQLLQQEEQRKSFGAAAAAFVKANYSVGSCADAFEKIYEQLKNEI
jgi:glycosyltransferase involved in cell wall biosynthesis